MKNDNLLLKKTSIIALILLAAFIASLMYIEFTSRVETPIWLSPVYVAMFILMILAVAMTIYAADKGTHPPLYPEID